MGRTVEEIVREMFPEGEPAEFAGLDGKAKLRKAVAAGFVDLDEVSMQALVEIALCSNSESERRQAAASIRQELLKSRRPETGVLTGADLERIRETLEEARAIGEGGEERRSLPAHPPTPLSV